MVLKHYDTLGRMMGVPRKCLLCGETFSPTGVRAKYCPKHNNAALRIARTLHAMKSRCAQAHMNQFKYYKGLSVCVEWAKNTHAFIVWSLANGWKEHGVIDRIDGTKGYDPTNCRWTDALGNSHNRLDNKTDFIKKTRRCSYCKLWKDFSEFHKTRNIAAGITYECKPCKKARDAEKHKRRMAT